MRKLLTVAAVAAVATLCLAGSASAQNVPARVGGAYGYPSQAYPNYPSQAYPSYPGQYSTPSHTRNDRDDKARKRRDRDDDDRGWRNDRDRADRGSNYGYNNGYGYGVNGAPSRVGEHDAAARARAAYGNNRNGRWDRDGR